MISAFNRNKAWNLILCLVLVISLEVGPKPAACGNIVDAHKVFDERSTRDNFTKLTPVDSSTPEIRTVFKILTLHSTLAEGIWVQIDGSKGLTKKSYVKIYSKEFQPVVYSALQPSIDFDNVRFHTLRPRIQGHGLKWAKPLQADGFENYKKDMRIYHLSCGKIIGGWKESDKETKQLIRTQQEEIGFTSEVKDIEDGGQGATLDKDSNEMEPNINTKYKETEKEGAIKVSLSKN